MTARFPKEEQFKLDSQMRRAVISVPSNIAEGAARMTDKDKVNFFCIARASLSKLDTRVEISGTLGFIPLGEKQRVQDRMDELNRMMNGLIASRQ